MIENTQRPLIGITCSYGGEYERGKLGVSGEYFSALWDAGALPVYLKWQDPSMPDGLSAIREYARTFDGFLFSGGVDIDPSYYGESVSHESVTIQADRDKFEIALFKEIYAATEKPILGICRGEQLINVALGGSLHQHIEGHSQAEPSIQGTHSVSIIRDTEFHKIIGGYDNIMVNTFHHQAVKVLAPTLRPSATSSDGIIEAYENVDIEKRFILAVQWHPELFHKLESHSSSLFKAFVQKCRKA